VGETTGVTWLITLGAWRDRGGGDLPRVLETLIYEGDKLERNKKILEGQLSPLHNPSYPYWGEGTLRDRSKNHTEHNIQLETFKQQVHISTRLL
jgi:hypothetical protein